MTLHASIRRVRNPKPNEAQQKAIENLDEDLLVAAGAGSGKTWVLTERYLEMLARGVRPSQIVAITFTELAAAEMKRRIRTAVQKWSEETADPLAKKRLKSIQSELDGAVISTIHGFCMRLLKEHPVEAGIDPLAEVLEPDEAQRLLEETVEEALEAALCDRFSEIQPLYLAWGGRRGIIQSLLQAYEDMQTFDYPVDRMLADTEASLAAMRGEIGAVVEEIDRLVGSIIRPELAALLGDNKKPPQYALHMQAWVDRWQEKSAFLRAWDGTVDPEVRRTLRDLLQSVWRKNGSEALREAHGQLKERLLPRLMQLEIAPDAMDRVRVFCRLLDAVDILYRQKKDRRHALDFHDLERLAARMLERHPSVAELYRKRFRFVMIDEFQDTNRLQKSILDRITGDDGAVKRFLVGDGKQSIYKFRGADVDVFQEVEEEHRTAGGERLIDMGVNFRTQAGIIRYVNDFFAALMGSAETEHAKQVRFAPLHAVRNPRHGHPCVEILVNGAAGEEADRDGEADLLARRIRELVDNGEPIVYRKLPGEQEETAAPVRYGDIALLFSATTHLAVYEQALQRYGIPYAVEKGRQFYKKQEIADICAWLTAIVDPADEVALAALLRSPVFALSDETLFWLAQAGSLRQGLELVAEDAGFLTDLQARLDAAEFAKTVLAARKLAEWRDSYPLRRLTDFLESILRESGYLQVLLAGFGGEQRYANVQKLLEIAEQWQRKEGYGVAEFADFLRRMRDEEVQETEAQLGSGGGSGGGAVRLMTVHASKGLEFPVVILPDLKRPLKTGDAVRCLIRPGMGVGLKAERYGDTAAEGELDVQGDGLFLRMRQRESERELLEEHRKLYVAMTRARDYLILVATKPKREARSWQKWILEHAGFAKFDEITGGILEKGDAVAGTLYRIFVNREVGQPAAGWDRERPQPWQAWRTRMGWESGPGTGQHSAHEDGTGIQHSVGQIAVRHSEQNSGPSAGQIAEPGVGRRTVQAPADSPDGPFALLFPVGDPGSLPLPLLSASAYMAYRTCQRRFYLKYLFRLPELRDTAARLAWTAPAGSLPDREETEMVQDAGTFLAADTSPGARPESGQRRLHGDLRGTLVHELFEQLRKPEQAPELVRRLVDRLPGMGAEERQAVTADLENMAARYLNSPWFCSESLREQPFYLKIGPIMVHGFIDLLVPEADGSLTVVDFKTNEIHSRQHMQELASQYRVQLQLYALAAEAVFRKPVKRALLFFLDAGEAVEVDVSRPALAGLQADLQQTCSKLSDRCTIDAYPMTEERAVCGRCGYRTLCGRSESGT